MEACIVCRSNETRETVRNGLPMFQCAVCGLVWRRDFDVDISHYEDVPVKLAEKNLTRRTRNVQDRIRLIERHLTPNDVCDIGPGEGLFLRELARKGYRNLIGIEPNKDAAAFGRAQGLDIIPGTLSDAPKIIREHGVHTVTLFHVIEHLTDPREALTSIYESLGKGDHLIIETPNADGYSFVRTNHQHPLVYPQHLFYFNMDNLARLLTDVGFTVAARGKRGFDQYNMSIRHALFCLGFGKPTFVPASEGSKSAGAVTGESVHPEGVSSYARACIRKMLNMAVILLGRVDYQWVIARK